MPASFWQRTKTGSKTGFDKVYGWVDKLGPPVNRLSNKLGSEAFWPTTLDKESDKAARILKSFCKDGFYEEETKPSADGPNQKQRVLKKIPSQVIRRAKGLAIFTTMRTGLWVSGAGGSGVLVARKEDGTWSPPSGIMLHTAGLGFLVGVDIYDCVVVINTQKALDAFSKVRCTLGGEVSAVAGPLGVGGILESELHKRQAPVFTYLKSRGFYAGVQIDGTVVIERTDENERFYNDRISVGDILVGKVRHPPYETKQLLETIRAAQGDTDVDESLLPSEPSPGDYELDATNGQVFGVPDKEDPDPFGVLALEKEGLEIREAGTQNRVSRDMFNFSPSPRSPIFSTFNRKSIDTQSVSQWSNSRRASQVSNYDRVVSMSDMSTQTDDDPPAFQRPMSGLQSNGIRDSIQERILEKPELEQDSQVVGRPYGKAPSEEDVSAKHVSLTNRSTNEPENDSVPRSDQAEFPSAIVKPEGSVDTETNGVLSTNQKSEEPEFPRQAEPVAVPAVEIKDDEEFEDDSDDDFEVFEEPVVVQQVQTPPVAQTITRARVVTVNKPQPPALPPRNPIRARKAQTPPDSTSSNDGSSTDPVITVTPDSSDHLSKDLKPEDARLSTASVGSVTNSIAQLRAFHDDDDTLAGDERDERDEFHSVSNSRSTSPTKPKFTAV